MMQQQQQQEQEQQESHNDDNNNDKNNNNNNNNHDEDTPSSSDPQKEPKQQQRQRQRQRQQQPAPCHFAQKSNPVVVVGRNALDKVKQQVAAAVVMPSTTTTTTTTTTTSCALWRCNKLLQQEQQQPACDDDDDDDDNASTFSSTKVEKRMGQGILQDMKQRAVTLVHPRKPQQTPKDKDQQQQQQQHQEQGENNSHFIPTTTTTTPKTLTDNRVLMVVAADDDDVQNSKQADTSITMVDPPVRTTSQTMKRKNQHQPRQDENTTVNTKRTISTVKEQESEVDEEEDTNTIENNNDNKNDDDDCNDRWLMPTLPPSPPTWLFYLLGLSLIMAAAAAAAIPTRINVISTISPQDSLYRYNFSTLMLLLLLWISFLLGHFLPLLCLQNATWTMIMMLQPRRRRRRRRQRQQREPRPISNQVVVGIQHTTTDDDDDDDDFSTKKSNQHHPATKPQQRGRQQEPFFGKVRYLWGPWWDNGKKKQTKTKKQQTREPYTSLAPSRNPKARPAWLDFLDLSKTKYNYRRIFRINYNNDITNNNNNSHYHTPSSPPPPDWNWMQSVAMNQSLSPPKEDTNHQKGNNTLLGQLGDAKYTAAAHGADSFDDELLLSGGRGGGSHGSSDNAAAAAAAAAIPTPMFQVRGMDIFLVKQDNNDDNDHNGTMAAAAAAPIFDVGNHAWLVQHGLRAVPTWVMNLVTQWGNVLIYLELPAWVTNFNTALKETPNDASNVKALKRFLSGNDEYRNARLQAIPCLVDGPMAVKILAPPKKARLLHGSSTMPLGWYLHDCCVTSSSSSSSPSSLAPVIVCSLDCVSSRFVRTVAGMVKKYMHVCIMDIALLIGPPLPSSNQQQQQQQQWDKIEEAKPHDLQGQQPQDNDDDDNNNNNNDTQELGAFLGMFRFEHVDISECAEFPEAVTDGVVVDDDDDNDDNVEFDKEEQQRDISKALKLSGMSTNEFLELQRDDELQQRQRRQKQGAALTTCE